MLHGLFWLTANVAADGPLCLSIDDLQWCDPASLRFIAYLERRLEGLRVLVATAARVGGANVASRGCSARSPQDPGRGRRSIWRR